MQLLGIKSYRDRYYYRRWSKLR